MEPELFTTGMSDPPIWVVLLQYKLWKGNLFENNLIYLKNDSIRNKCSLHLKTHDPNQIVYLHLFYSLDNSNRKDESMLIPGHNLKLQSRKMLSCSKWLNWNRGQSYNNIIINKSF